jgi:hypothetical protein
MLLAMSKPKYPESLPADALAWTQRGEDAPDIDFTPVPRLRRRRDGWSEQRQRVFIAALALCGTVSAAARAVGSTARSAYRLLDAPGADSFAAAWDAAIDQGYARMQAEALERALKGAFVPVYRRGKLAQVEHRRCDKLAIALLNGQDRDPLAARRTAVSRREHRLDLAAKDAAEAERDRRIAEAEEAYRTEVQRLIGKIHLGPRIAAL